MFIKSKMEVTVLSIFAIKPPNRRHDENTSIAFRVCIPQLESTKLCDVSKLPGGIIVKEWYFKQSNNSNIISNSNTQSQRPITSNTQAGGVRRQLTVTTPRSDRTQLTGAVYKPLNPNSPAWNLADCRVLQSIY